MIMEISNGRQELKDKEKKEEILIMGKDKFTTFKCLFLWKKK